jgi:hypothetical protein
VAFSLRLVTPQITLKHAVRPTHFFDLHHIPTVLCAHTEALDTGDAIPPRADPLAVAQVLLDLLSSLREPVIPTAYFPGIAQLCEYEASPLTAPLFLQAQTSSLSLSMRGYPTYSSS